MEWRKDSYTISDDSTSLQLEVIVVYLARAYWSQGRPRAVIEKSLHHSLNFGVYHESEQVGFARVVSDHATFAYLCDVFVLESHQGHGLGKWLVETILEHPELQTIRRFLLATRDAHGLYAQHGFTPLEKPELFMSRFRPNMYTNSTLEP